MASWRDRLLLRPINLATVERFLGAAPEALKAAAWVEEDAIAREERRAAKWDATRAMPKRSTRGIKRGPRAAGVEKGGRPAEWPARLAPLVLSRGEWAAVAKTAGRSNATSLARDLNVGRYARPEGRWEFVSRTIRDDAGEVHYLVFGRYVGR